MKLITEYLSTKIVQTTKIKATDETIHQIVKDELDRLGHDADLNHIDVSRVTNMNELFSLSSYSTIKQVYEDLNPDISKWDVSNVKDMSGMFYNCANFNCDISGWDVSNVEYMTSLFHYCENFNQDISKWKVGNVKIMKYMFFYCKKFNQNLSMWDISNVKDARYMFDCCPIKEEFKPKFKK